MPEIEVTTDSANRATFKFNILLGESSMGLTKTNMRVSTAMSYISSFRRTESVLGAQGYRQKAEATLARIMPAERANEMIEAVINNAVGTKATIVMRGETEEQGFIFKSLERP